MSTADIKKQLLFWIGRIDSLEKDKFPELSVKISEDISQWTKIVTPEDLKHLESVELKF